MMTEKKATLKRAENEPLCRNSAIKMRQPMMVRARRISMPPSSANLRILLLNPE